MLTPQGELQPLQDPVEAGELPLRMLLSPDQRFLYLLDNPGPNLASALFAYTISQDGSLSKRSAGKSDLPPLFSSFGMAFHPTGKKMYFTEFHTAESSPSNAPPNSLVSVYGVDAEGFVSPETTRKSDAFPSAVAVTPDGQHVYVTTIGTGQVCRYDADATTGEVTSPNNPNDSPPCVPTGLLPLAVQVGPSGAYAWVANNGDDSQPGSVTAFTILPSGVLSQIAEVETGGDASGHRVQLPRHVWRGAGS